MTKQAQGQADNYVAQSNQSLAATLAGYDDVARHLGGSAGDWQIEEIGDGNLNLVFIVSGPTGQVAVKQALPYVRLVGESWPLPLSRTYYETTALRQQARYAEAFVPAVLHFDEPMALLVMECLSPHMIMRKGMIAANEYPHFADHISSFMAQSLFFTSDLFLSAAEKKQLIATFAGNTALCKITEDLIFTEPYIHADNNHWTTPYLDDYARAFRQDADLKIAVSRAKLQFMSSAQALIHGDLHTGSIMVTETETKVIDPEFAFVGPMGFDIGALLANLLINYFSHAGHETENAARDSYRDWVLATTEQVWHSFTEKFLALWQSQAKGDAYPEALFAHTADGLALAREQQAYMQQLFADSLGFCGAKMIRRILGLAHNLDLESIEDPARRAPCEARILLLARDLLVNRAAYATIESVCLAARRFNAIDPLAAGLRAS